MRRIPRLSADIRARLIRSLPLLAVPILFLFLHKVPIVGGILRNIEGGIGERLMRVGIALRYVFTGEEVLRAEFAQCTWEKAQLSSQLGRVIPQQDQGETTIIARGYASDSHSAVLSIPENLSVKMGDAIVTQGGLAGVVTSVQVDTAVVRLLSHAQSRIPVMVLGKERTIGLAVGTTGAWLDLLYLPKDADVIVGDVLVTSGLGGMTPIDIPVGIITEIAFPDASPFLRARVSPLVNPDMWSSGQVVANLAL